MKKIHIKALIFSAFLFSVLPLGPLKAETFSFELMTGDAYNIPTVLTVHQTGYPDISLSAIYDSEPFGRYAPYYSWRAALWDKDEAWEFQQIHHRLFLQNLTPEITDFEIHFGYNLFMAGHAWRRNGFIFHLDAGLVITNPQNTVRGQTLNTFNAGILDQGYYLSGVVAQAAVSRRLYFAANGYVNLEIGFTSAWASVPIASGNAYVPNLAVHGHFGLGFCI